MIVQDILTRVEDIQDIVNSYKNNPDSLNRKDIERAVEFLEEYRDELLSMKVVR